MIVAVLDTNVLASGSKGFRRDYCVPGEVVRRWRRAAFTLVISQTILTELARAFSYPYFAQRLSAEEIESAFSMLRRQARLQRITAPVTGIAAHPADDLILATALSALADYPVTCDRRLRARGAYGGTTLLTPRQFLDVLDQTVVEQPRDHPAN